MKKICNVLTNSELNFIKMACRSSSAYKERCNLQAIIGKGCWILLLASQRQPCANCINAVYNSLSWPDFKSCNSKTNFLDLEESQYFHFLKKHKVRLYYIFMSSHLNHLYLYYMNLSLIQQFIPWCWERLKAEGEDGDRGWDGWMASPVQRTRTWANSGRWCRAGQGSLACCSPWVS